MWKENFLYFPLKFFFFFKHLYIEMLNLKNKNKFWVTVERVEVKDKSIYMVGVFKEFLFMPKIRCQLFISTDFAFGDSTNNRLKNKIPEKSQEAKLPCSEHYAGSTLRKWCISMTCCSLFWFCRQPLSLALIIWALFVLVFLFSWLLVLGSDIIFFFFFQN